MADPVELPSQPPAPATRVAQIPHAREMSGEQLISGVLRTGAVLAGLCFLTSLVIELLPPSVPGSIAIEVLRKGGVALLIITPVLRLVAAGVVLGMRGEWRYTFYAACIVLLLALAVTAGFAA